MLRSPVHALATLSIATLVPQDTAPPSNPSQPRGLIHSADGACVGYTLIAPLRSTTTFLLDMNGEVVHRWESEYPPGSAVHLSENGRLLRAYRALNPHFRQAHGQGGGIQELDWDGEVLWSHSLSSPDRLAHHDVERLSNGNVLVIAWERISRDAAVAAGRDPEHVSEDGLWPDLVMEIEPVRPDGGRVVWEWRAWDHLIQDFDSGAANHGDVTAHPERVDLNADCRDRPPPTAEERRRLEVLEADMRRLGYAGGADDGGAEGDGSAGGRPGRPRKPGDWLHTNSIDHLPGHDLIVLSIHALDEVWVIDHSTTTEEAAGGSGGRWGRGGDLLYRWGNPRTYGAGTRDDQRLFSQHDARWVTGEDGSLSLTVFNNGGDRPDGPWSSVDEIRLPFDPEHGFVREPGAPFGPEEPSWSYRADGFLSSFVSGAERLPGGNTLICSGAQARVFEVTPDGEVVWDYRNGLGAGRGGAGDGEMGPGALFRAARLPADYPGLARLGR